MPSYTFKNTNNDEITDSIMSMAERETFLHENPHIIQIIKTAPSIGDSIRLGIRKPDDGFRDVLRNVQHHHKKDNINTF